MFLYLMKILFSKTYYLHHIYFNLNRIFITEQYNIIIYELLLSSCINRCLF
ncbi:hypothetical protein, partial [Plasmodium yoelii yoelii]